jgi:hypothetical protein
MCQLAFSSISCEAVSASSQVVTVVTVKNGLYWDVVLFSLIGIDQRFEEHTFLNIQCSRGEWNKRIIFLRKLDTSAQD